MSEADRPTRLNPDEDARLVQRCLEGDVKAWASLVRRHERLVYSVARSYRLAPEEAGDVFQEVFAALVRGLPRIRDARALVRWLSSTTDRIARATALRRRRELALGIGDDPAGLDRIAAEGPPIEADLEELEARARVRLALEALSPQCRRLLTALYYEDPAPAYADLARRLGTPIGSLGPTRARCLERMRQVLARLESGPATGAETATGTPGRVIQQSHSQSLTGPPGGDAAGISQPTKDTFPDDGAESGVAREENAPTRGEDDG